MLQHRSDAFGPASVPAIPQTELVQTALVDPQELKGYEEWKLAKGGFFWRNTRCGFQRSLHHLRRR